MPFVFDADDAVSRIRAFVGWYDTTLPHDDAFFESMLTLAGDDVTVATRMSAAALAAFYANQPSQVSSNGSGVTWAERIKQWNLIANGAALAVASDTDTTGAFSYAPVRVDGYSTRL